MGCPETLPSVYHGMTDSLSRDGRASRGSSAAARCGALAALLGTICSFLPWTIACKHGVYGEGLLKGPVWLTKEGIVCVKLKSDPL